LSRDEGSFNASKDLRTLFPHRGELAIIVDDREDVWSASIDNLLPICPYLFWKGEGDINEPIKLQQTPKNDIIHELIQTNGSEIEKKQEIENGDNILSTNNNKKRTR